MLSVVSYERIFMYTRYMIQYLARSKHRGYRIEMSDISDYRTYD